MPGKRAPKDGQEEGGKKETEARKLRAKAGEPETPRAGVGAKQGRSALPGQHNLGPRLAPLPQPGHLPLWQGDGPRAGQAPWETGTGQARTRRCGGGAPGPGLEACPARVGSMSGPGLDARPVPGGGTPGPWVDARPPRGRAPAPPGWAFRAPRPGFRTPRPGARAGGPSAVRSQPASPPSEARPDLPWTQARQFRAPGSPLEQAQGSKAGKPLIPRAHPASRRGRAARIRG